MLVPTRYSYEEAFLPKGKKQPRSLRSLDLASLKAGQINSGRFPNKKNLAPRAATWPRTPVFENHIMRIKLVANPNCWYHLL